MVEGRSYKKIAYLSLGANLGDRAGQIAQALTLLEQAGVHITRRSALYETQPVDVTPQPWFLNCLVEVETELLPLGLLRVVQRIERQLGRQRHPEAATPGPRTIDIDIIFFGDHVVRLPELTIPHPRLAERRFVLEPLRELAPDFRHPITRKTAAEMLAELTSPAQTGGGLPAQVRRYRA